MEERDQEVYPEEEIAFNLLSKFIGQCGEMAEKNWCPAQVEMLTRLFGAVLKGVEYADWEPDTEENATLKEDLEELYEICRGCNHEDDCGKEACDSCGNRRSINNIEMELSEMEEIE